MTAPRAWHARAGQRIGRSSGDQIHLDGVVGDRCGPEQASLVNPGIEVVQLRPRTGVEDVDSGETERRIANVAVPAHELALHEPHVAGEEGKLDLFARLAIAA